MADKNAIFDHVATTLSELFDLERSDIKLESHLSDDLDIDSIDAIDLIVELKKYVGRKIGPEDFKSVRTVGDIVNAVSDIMGAQA
ncbi:MAG: acyl carrier protein [Gammaproteobacteria bacterium]|nr:MAG: acyl carrier protein [Gammaproteobacteria bacterium]